MPAQQPARPSFPVVFVDAFWREDLDVATEAGVRVAVEIRAMLEREGARAEELMRCGTEQGTDLAGCVKLYAPSRRPPGNWGMVFEGRHGDALGIFLSPRPSLVSLADFAIRSRVCVRAVIRPKRMPDSL